MRIRLALSAVALALVALGSAAAADVAPIPADAQKPFKHEPSGIVIPASAAGLPRSAVVEWDDKQLDVAADFHSADETEVTTLYVFRKVTGDVPLWFDRIRQVVQVRKDLSSPTIAIPTAAFTPAGQPNARGLRAVWASSGSTWKSSAAALTTTGEWFVAVRASSKTLTPEQLLARVEQTFAAIKWPAQKEQAPAAYQITDCANALVQGHDAEPVTDVDASVVASALTATLTETLKSKGMVKPPRWCRDPFTVEGASIYRPDGAMDRFLVAMQDAGRGIWVAPIGLSGILIGATSNASPDYIVELVDIDRHTGFGSFKTLPTIAQAIWLSQNGPRTYVAHTWGNEKTKIEVFTDTAKK
jgi:hypothetical protein